MSKASEWATKEPADFHTVLFNADVYGGAARFEFPLSSLTTYGNYREEDLRGWVLVSETDALALGRWLVETFGEEP